MWRQRQPYARRQSGELAPIHPGESVLPSLAEVGEALVDNGFVRFVPLGLGFEPGQDRAVLLLVLTAPFPLTEHSRKFLDERIQIGSDCHISIMAQSSANADSDRVEFAGETPE